MAAISCLAVVLVVRLIDAGGVIRDVHLRCGLERAQCEQIAEQEMREGSRIQGWRVLASCQERPPELGRETVAEIGMASGPLVGAGSWLSPGRRGGSLASPATRFTPPASRLTGLASRLTPHASRS